MLYYKKFGTNKKTAPLVLLHGWEGNWQSWLPIIERLKGDFVIYALDLPGFGLSKIKHPLDLSEYAKIINEFIKHLGVKPTIIGHSFGGSITIKIASQYPDSIKNLVLVNSSGVRIKNPAIEVKRKVAHLAGILFSLPILNVFYRPLRSLVYHFWAKGSDYESLSDNKNLKQTFLKILDEDLTPVLGKIQTPTLIFWGKNDQETSLFMADILQRGIARSKLVVIPDAGHFSYLDSQEKFCEVLKEFLR